MKKTLTLLLALVLGWSQFANAQVKDTHKQRFSYYAISFGNPIDANRNDISLTLIDLNIAAKNGWGGTAYWSAIVNPRKNAGLYQFYVAGPSYSFETSIVTLTAKALFGLGDYQYDIDTQQRMHVPGTHVAVFGAELMARFVPAWRVNPFISVGYIGHEMGEHLFNPRVGISFSW